METTNEFSGVGQQQQQQPQTVGSTTAEAASNETQPISPIITTHKFTQGRCECDCHARSGVIAQSEAEHGVGHCGRCHDQHMRVFRRVPKRADGLNLNDSAIMSASVGGAAATSSQLVATAANAEDYVFYCYSTAAEQNGGDEEVGREEETARREAEKRRRRRKREAAAAGRDEDVSSEDICCYCCCFCCAKKLSDSRVCRVLHVARIYLQKFVDGQFFQRTILFAILINTLSMGIEHHQQVHNIYFYFFFYK